MFKCTPVEIEVPVKFLDRDTHLSVKYVRTSEERNWFEIQIGNHWHVVIEASGMNEVGQRGVWNENIT